MDKKRTDQYGVPLDDEEFLKQTNVASSMDCTGLMPNAPCNGEEAESYSAIYNIPQTKVDQIKSDFSQMKPPITDPSGNGESI